LARERTLNILKIGGFWGETGPAAVTGGIGVTGWAAGGGDRPPERPQTHLTISTGQRAIDPQAAIAEVGGGDGVPLLTAVRLMTPAV
jgi:hypothetical protein